MKRVMVTVLLIAVLSMFFCSCQTENPIRSPNKGLMKRWEENPPETPETPETDMSYLEPELLDGTTRNPIVTHIFMADPTARAFEGRIYLYTSHDRDNATTYNMNDYHVFSSDDLVNWQDHGIVLETRNFWASSLYAPDCVYDEINKRYILFFPNSGSNIGVVVSDTPYGPFEDPLGKPLITPKYPGAEVEWCFDPGVLVDDDGHAYLYFGGGMPESGNNARVIRLGEDMISLKDDAATTIEAPDYFEAPFTFKKDGKYYYTYSTNWENGHEIRIDYMMSDDPMTGWEYKGVVINNPPDNHGNNNHHSIVEYEGDWYVFYHSRNLAISQGNMDVHQRSVNIERMFFTDNGEIIRAEFTKGDIEQLRNVNAYGRIEAEFMAAESGVETSDIYDGEVKTGVALTDLHDGNWSAVSQVDFGDGVESFTVSVSSEREGGKIELWIDGGNDNGGTLIGTCDVPNTGVLKNFQEITCDTEPVSGVHNLYLVYRGPLHYKTLFMLDYYFFK